MPKITIDLNANTHRILKELAKKDRRSLTNYINITLENYALNNEKNISENTIDRRDRIGGDESEWKL